MIRHILCIVIAISLLTGCWHNKKNKQTSSNAQASGQQHHQPGDPFETMEDPPFTAKTRFAAGQLAESQGDHVQAIKQYREALRLDPNHRDSIFRLGQLLTQERKYDEAIELWQKYLAVTNQSPAAYNNLAFCYENAGRFDDAEKTYKAGIARDPESSACRYNYGLMLARRGRINDAMAQLTTVLSPAEANYNIGSVYEQQGQTAQAKAYYTKALELNPKLRDARARLAALNQGSGASTAPSGSGVR